MWRCNILLIDSNEPDNIVKLLRQSCPVTVANLNMGNMSDYFFGSYDGKRLQFSRKQAGELVGGVDEAEKQLAEYYHNAEKNYQIIEGIISPDKLKIKGVLVPIDGHGSSVSTRDLGARLFCYKVEPGGFIEKGHSFTAVNDSLIAVWIHRLAEAGIPTYRTINWVETARLLSAIYRNEQKPPEEHSTLQRVVRPRIHIRGADPFMKSLLFLSNAYQLGIGEKKAKALTGRFCHILDMATSTVEDLAATEGIGKKMAERILSSLGRDV